MPHGGKRQSPPGRVHPNRTDLTTSASAGQTVAPPNTPAPTEHGQKAARERQQAALPAGRQSRPNRLQGPSERPNEPVQAGLPIGPGPGPSGVVGSLGTLDRLRAIYGRFPNDELARMIEYLSSRQR